MRAPMATATRPGPFARKSHDVLVRDATADPEHGLKRSVGVLDLTALGIGAVIGTGIFVIIGEAIGDRRPVDHHLLRPRGRDVPVLGLLLRRTGLVDPGLGQRVHLRLRDPGRAGRVDHRLGPDPRVRRGGGGGRRGLGRLPASRCWTRCSASPSRSRSPGRPARAAPPTCPPSSSCSPCRRCSSTASARARGRTPSWSSRRSPSSSSSSSSAWARSTATTSRPGLRTGSAGRSTRPR